MNISEVLNKWKIENVSISHIIESETANVWRGLDVTDVVRNLKNDLTMHVAKYPDIDVHMKFGDFVEENPSFKKYLELLSK